MSKTFRWDDKHDPRKTTQKAKHDIKQQGRKAKQQQQYISYKADKE